MSINEIQDEIIEEFDMLDEWFDRYQALIDYGKDLPPFPEELRTKQNLIEGCQSEVWFVASLNDGKVCYQATSDAVLVKGIVALLLRVLNNQACISLKRLACRSTSLLRVATDSLPCSTR